MIRDRRAFLFFGPGLDASLTLRPIGHLRTAQRVKFDAGHQPVAAREEESVIELVREPDLREALRDLEGFSHIWLVSWFHRNTRWRPLVLPPRGPAKRRGVFATRSPHRPNPLGLTVVPLLGVEPLRLRIGPCDLIDGTPILDIKPYVPSADAFPEASSGWIEEVDAAEQREPAYSLALSPLAQAQAAWLREEWQVDFLDRLKEILTHDPTPHRTRRIRRNPTHGFEIGCGAWRGYFDVKGDAIEIKALGPAYPLTFLLRESYRNVPDREAQLAFLARWAEADRGLHDPA